ncbi:hypothetical protein BpHYR1_029182 [Brachionus plicatilis]|uniref:Uncharacterized protein n=1 Tax=Brachionus plicatilis TaxID=10195 RepID=A0A3M7RLD3_BRAPC|nr:hypothetical protein BpHYR1_029182 [Brachionus plicatilis]
MFRKLKLNIGYEKSYGIKNSNLIKIHCVGDPRVKEICLQIKYFSKTYQINGSQQQFISSYYFVTKIKYFGWLKIRFKKCWFSIDWLSRILYKIRLDPFENGTLTDNSLKNLRIQKIATKKEECLIADILNAKQTKLKELSRCELTIVTRVDASTCFFKNRRFFN